MTTPKDNGPMTPKNLPVLRRVTMADVRAVEEHLKKRQASKTTKGSTQS
jgi:hypothetical protein